MSEQASGTARKIRLRFRSPPFPSLPLARAIERAEQLYRVERDHLAPVDSAAKAWGMSPTSSGPIVTIGALKQYGLLDDDGVGDNRKVRLTHDALRIILDKIPDSPERVDALKRAFFAPKIFQELWNKWRNDLPSEQTMTNYLVLERKLKNQAPFSPQSASELLANYRASLPFARPDVEASLPPSNSEVGGEEEMSTHIPSSVPRPDTTTPVMATTLAQPLPSTVAPSTGAERVVFVEEGGPNQYLKVVASGDIDEILLDALSNYVSRQKRRLSRHNDA